MLVMQCRLRHCRRRVGLADAGAGVGRVTQELLLKHFGTVDLLEPSKHLLDTAQEKLAALSKIFPTGHRPGKFLYQGLETFVPENQRYDCIWLQW
jgi:protein N-terminal methyltransferase